MVPRPGKTASAAAESSELFERAAIWPHDPSLDDLSAERLREITDAEGVDFATVLLYERVRRASRHTEFIRRIDRFQAEYRTETVQPRLDGVRFVVAPGAFYKEFPHIEADGRLVRRVAAGYGCQTHLIPVPTTGSLPKNAEIILDWLREHRGRPVILATPSKGGADVRLALERDPAAFGDVVGWMNICGMLEGTPLADALLNRRLRSALVREMFRWRRFDFRMVRDLRTGPDSLFAREFRPPRRLEPITIVGFPLTTQMTNRRARMWRRALDPLGPNDGGILLAGPCRWPGSLYPVWGADHYLSPTRFDMESLATAVLREFAERPALQRFSGRSNGPTSRINGSDPFAAPLGRPLNRDSLDQPPR